MSLVTVKELLTPLPQGWAVGSFNVYSLEDIKAVVAAAELESSPAIMMVSESGLRHIGIDYAAKMCVTAAQNATVPLAVQLDHGQDFEVVARCIKAGFSSVMIDGSRLPFEENVILTRQVVDMAHACGVSVEGELGRIGGKEDDLEVSKDDAGLVDPDEVEEFIERTGVDLFVPAIGTAHGFYAGTPHLDFERLQKVRRLVDVPLVLHGASGLSDDTIFEAISFGAAKINVGTELKAAATGAFKRVASEQPEKHDPMVYSRAATDAVQAVVQAKMRLFGSSSRV